MWIFYHNVVEPTGIGLNFALGIPLLFVGLGLWIDTFLEPETDE